MSLNQLVILLSIRNQLIQGILRRFPDMETYDGDMCRHNWIL